MTVKNPTHHLIKRRVHFCAHVRSSFSSTYHDQGPGLFYLQPAITSQQADPSPALYQLFPISALGFSRKLPLNPVCLSIKSAESRLMNPAAPLFLCIAPDRYTKLHPAFLNVPICRVTSTTCGTMAAYQLIIIRNSCHTGCSSGVQVSCAPVTPHFLFTPVTKTQNHMRSLIISCKQFFEHLNPFILLKPVRLMLCKGVLTGEKGNGSGGPLFIHPN